MHPEEATQQILTGRAAAGLTVDGTLDLSAVTRSFQLPKDLQVKGNFKLSGSAVEEIPDGVRVKGHIAASRCAALVRVGRIQAESLSLEHAVRLTTIAGPLRIHTVHLTGCIALTHLPDRVSTEFLVLKDCIALESLPKMYGHLLNIEGCRRLRTVPDGMQVVNVDERTGVPYDWRRFDVDEYLGAHWIVSGHTSGGLRVRGVSCLRHTWLRKLPAAMYVRGDLNLEGCDNLTELPADLVVTGKVTLTGCRKLTKLQDGLRAATLVLPDGTEGKPAPPKTSFLSTLSGMAFAIRVLAMSLDPPEPSTTPRQSVGAEDARRAIAAGERSVIVREELRLSGLPDLKTLPGRLWVFGNLTLSDLDSLKELPRDLRVTGQIRIERCAALSRMPSLSVDYLTIERCPSLTRLPRIATGTLNVAYCDALEDIHDGIVVNDSLSVSNCGALTRISDSVHPRSIGLENLPKLERVPSSPLTVNCSLRQLPLVTELTIQPGVRGLTVRNLESLRTLPAGLELFQLEISGCPSLTALPAGLCVTKELVVHGCPGIRIIPRDTRAVGFRASELPALESIDAPWQDMSLLSLRDCRALTALPPTLRSIRDALDVEGCRSLTALPDGVDVRGRLNLTGCASLRRLPAQMPAPESAEIGGSGLEAWPSAWSAVKLTWRNMVFTERQLFRTDTMTPDEILNERNVEVRSILLERYGMARLIERAAVRVLDEDTDPGGSRRLLVVPVAEGESIFTLHVHCPSTGRPFYLRVPPHVTSCRQAAAWVAGFFNPNDYNPIVET